MRIAAKLAIVASIFFAAVGVIAIVQGEVTGAVIGGAGVLIGVAMFLTNRGSSN
jgi:hypothetical protein